MFDFLFLFLLNIKNHLTFEFVFKLILSLIFGILIGTLTGLIPSIHINLIAFLILIYFEFLSKYFNSFFLILFILSMSLTHTFIDYLSSIFFSIVDETTVASLTPTQNLVSKKKALDAVYYSTYGSFYGGIIAFILLVPISFLTLKLIDKYIHNFLFLILSFTILILIFSQKDKIKIFQTLILVLFSGSLGLIILNSYILANPLLIVLTGIFSIPLILEILYKLLFKKKENKKLLNLLKSQNRFISKDFNYLFKEFEFKNHKLNFQKLNNSKQNKVFNLNKNFIYTNTKNISLFFKILKYFKSTNFTILISYFISIIPAFTSSIAALIISLFLKEKLPDEIKIFQISMINTINFIISIYVFYLLFKSRNGVIVSISNFYKFSLENLIFFSILLFFLLYFLKKWTIFLSNICLFIFSKINFLYLLFSIFIFLNFLIFFVDGFYGLYIMYVCSILGFLALKLGVQKVMLMNVIIFPTLIYLL